MKSNAELQKLVNEELSWDPRIHEGDIGVSVMDGIVTLSGHIPTFAEKWAAEEATKKVCGVKAVVNQIDVHPAGVHARDDQDIAKAVLNAIQWNVWLACDDIKPTVQKGFVTLSGTVGSEYQRREAESAVKHIPGVRGVLNGINVRPSATPKDVETQIKKALHRHAEDEASQIKVSVMNGEVHLTGKVNSWSDKTEAEWAAMATAGVRKVKNDVQVTYT